MNERVTQLINYLRVLADLKTQGTQCNTEINAVMALLKDELLNK
ncbi:hypothetical protein [Planococcus sp. S3-L1]|nr:hypothetical protein [Planococcus sp. S3-L1]MDJ0332119.1 hypothetical protein [Planococcus sp. S3-L1]